MPTLREPALRSARQTSNAGRRNSDLKVKNVLSVLESQGTLLEVQEGSI
jgi:hypothetical protein